MPPRAVSATAPTQATRAHAAARRSCTRGAPPRSQTWRRCACGTSRAGSESDGEYESHSGDDSTKAQRSPDVHLAGLCGVPRGFTGQSFDPMRASNYGALGGQSDSAGATQGGKPALRFAARTVLTPTFQHPRAVRDAAHVVRWPCRYRERGRVATRSQPAELLQQRCARARRGRSRCECTHRASRRGVSDVRRIDAVAAAASARLGAVARGRHERSRHRRACVRLSATRHKRVSVRRRPPSGRRGSCTPGTTPLAKMGSTVVVTRAALAEGAW